MDKKIDIQTRVIPAKGRSKYSDYSRGYSSSTIIRDKAQGDISLPIVTVESESELQDNNVLSALRSIKEILSRIISDPVEASDKNTLSAKYTVEALSAINEVLDKLDTNYLSKIKPDSTKHLLQLLGGLSVNATHNINKLGDAILRHIKSDKLTADKIIAKDITSDIATINELISKLSEIHNLKVTDTARILKTIVEETLSSEKFVSGFTGEGFRIAQAINGDWNLEIDNIIVRKVFQVFELLVQEIKHQGGMVLHSPAGGKITKVTDGGSHWKCEIESADTFFKDDLAICQKFTGTIKRYWRAVTSVGTGYINLSKSDCETGSSIPEIGDEIAVQGNKTNTSRQSVYIVSVVGADAPYTAYYSGINSYSLKDKLVTREGNLNGIIDKDFGQLKGYGLYANNAYLKGILRLTNGKTVEQELLSTNNTVEANRLQLGGEIDKAKADAKVANDKIDSLQIGGRNYLLNSAIPRKVINATQQYAALEYNVSGNNLNTSLDLRDSVISYSFLVTDIDGFNGELTTGIYNFNTKEVIAWIRRLSPVNGVYKSESIYVPKNELNHRLAIMVYCGVWGETLGNSFTVLNMNIIKGNKVTDWSPAPEDLDAELVKQITNVRTDFDVIEGQINANVAKTETLVNQTNGLVEETKQTASQVNQTAEEINQNVSRAEQSANRAETAETNINTKADGIVMEASRQSAEKAIDGIKPEIEATNSKLELLNNQFSVEVAKTDGIRTDLTTLTQDHDSFKIQVKTDINGAIDNNNEVIKSSFTMNGNKIGLLGSEIDMTGKVTFSAFEKGTQERINNIPLKNYAYNKDGKYLCEKLPENKDIPLVVTFFGDFKNYADEIFAFEINYKPLVASKSTITESKWVFFFDEQHYNGNLDSGGVSIETVSGDDDGFWKRVNDVKVEISTYATDFIKNGLDRIGLAKLDNTIIEGGFIKTSLIEANSITADKINVQSLESVRLRTGNLDVLEGATIAGWNVVQDAISIKVDTNSYRDPSAGINYVGLKGFSTALSSSLGGVETKLILQSDPFNPTTTQLLPIGIYTQSALQIVGAPFQQIMGAGIIASSKTSAPGYVSVGFAGYRNPTSTIPEDKYYGGAFENLLVIGNSEFRSGMCINALLKLSTETQINSDDCMIINRYHNKIFTLPLNPKNGQIIMIRNVGDATSCTVNAIGNQTINESNKTTIDFRKRNIHYMIFLGAYQNLWVTGYLNM